MIDSILYQNCNLNKIIELIVLDDNSENLSDLYSLKKISNISKNNKIINCSDLYIINIQQIKVSFQIQIILKYQM